MDVREKIQRLLLVISYARRHRGATVAEVAQAAGLSAEELRSSVPQLSLIGKPPFAPDDLVDISIEGDRVYVELDQALGRPLRLTQPEWLALAIALRTLALSNAGSTSELARSTLEKLKALSGDSATAALERQFAIEGEDQPGAAETFRVLEQALRERKQVEITYYTAGRDELRTRGLQPYALVQFLGSWYAVGHDDYRDEVRVFKVERIREARLTETSFVPPADFDAGRWARARMLDGPKGGVARIRFRPPVARLIAEEHPPEKVTPEPDGSVVLALDYQHPSWAASWALSFGDAAEVLSPEEVRREIATRCRDALAHYR